MKRFLYKTFIIASFALLLSIIGSVVLTIVYKDEIAGKVLSSFNDQVNGTFTFNDQSINIREHFPNVSLKLDDVHFIEDKNAVADSTEKTLFKFSSVYLSFNILKLFDSNIVVKRLTLKNGLLNLRQLADSTMNVEKAFVNPEQNESTEDIDSVFVNSPLIWAIEKLSLEGVEINIDLLSQENYQSFRIDQTAASLNYLQDSVKLEVDAGIFIHHAGFNKISLLNEELKMSLSMMYHVPHKKLEIRKSELMFKEASFYTKGIVNMEKEPSIDLAFQANDNELRFTKLFLTSEGIENLQSGNIKLSGTASGSFSQQLPELKINFGAEKLVLLAPEAENYLVELDMDGWFSSGNKLDLSEALLEIDTINARFSSGFLKAKLRVSDFAQPTLFYDVNALLKLDELDQVFNIPVAKGLGGHVELKNKYHGAYQKELSWKDLAKEELYLRLDSVEFELEDIMTFQLVDGSITGNLDSIELNSFNIQAGNTDLRVDGAIWNLSELVLNGQRPMSASMKVTSNWFDFPDFFTFLPDVAKAFPYDIKDVLLDLEISTSSDQLTNFQKVPEIDFQISQASGEVETLFNFAMIEHLDFRMHEKDCVSIFDFTGFSIGIDQSAIEGDFSLFSYKNRADSMVADLKNCAINPVQVFSIIELDSIPTLIDAWISGDFLCSILLPEDKSLLFQQLNLTADDFSYLGIDTITSKYLNVDSRNISYDQSNANILSTLKASNHLSFQQIASTNFKTDDLELLLHIDSGVYKIITEDGRQLGFEEDGFLEIAPFEDPPTYHLDYTVQNLAIQHLLTSFYNDSIFTGLVNLDLDLKSEGYNVEEITSNMSGKIHLEGDSLTLYGMDLDNVINNFKRSQSFNLVDVGAVALAGPAGILYSKGSDYAVMLTSKRGDSTQVLKASSKWSLTDGNISIDDVAFSTTENRVAAQGWLNMRTDSLDVNVGVIDVNGCLIIDQRIFGSSTTPEYGKVKVFKTLFSPISKLINNIIDKQCKPFYEGIVQHPVPPRKK